MFNFFTKLELVHYNYFYLYKKYLKKIRFNKLCSDIQQFVSCMNYMCQ